MLITIARKPLIKNVCENITSHNIGGINIEDCRVGNEDTRSPTSLSALGQNSGWNNHENRVVMAGSKNGRWPANLILQHTSACVLVGTKKVKVPKHRNPSTAKSLFCHTNHEKLVRPDRAFSDFSGEDGCETVEDWRCLIGCPKTLLDNQSGMIASRYFKVLK